NEDTIAIGAPNDDEATAGDRGSVYVFVRSGSSWSQQQRLLGTVGIANGFSENFGTSVAADGDTIVVGSPNVNFTLGTIGRGGVYIFDRSGTTWAEKVHFGSPQNVIALFGSAVALNGDSFIAGAPSDTVALTLGEGAAYVFATGETVSIADLSLAEGNSGT